MDFQSSKLLSKHVLRRTFARGMLIAPLQFFCTRSISQDTDCEALSLLDDFGVKECTLRQVFEFPFRPASQKNTMWCWAACLEAILLFKNVDFVSQHDIVVRLFGGTANIPANMQLIEAGINGEWRDSKNPLFAVKCSAKVFLPDENSDFETALSEAMKFFQDEETHIAIGLRAVAGQVGHLVLANEFRISQESGTSKANAIQVFDPLLPETGSGFRNLSDAELGKIDLIFSVQIEVL